MLKANCRTLGLTIALVAGGAAALASQRNLSLREEGERAAGFHQVFQAGARDVKGKFMGGTIMAALVPHDGKLFAVNGFTWDQPGNDPAPGAQVLVLDRPGGDWRLDYELRKSAWRASLKSVTFTTDGQGRPLTRRVPMLLAASSNTEGGVNVYSRDDATGTWTAMTLAQAKGTAKTRSLALHHDRVTGVDRVFAGSLPSGLFSGVYDPAAPGRIHWDSTPELSGYQARAMGFAECGGDLYVAIKPNLYRRIDGEHPRWERVYTIPGDFVKESSGLRGLTTIDQSGGRGQALLAALEGRPARIVRIDPEDGYKETVELDLLDFLERQWGRRPSWVIAAYNDAAAATDPRTGKKALLIGLSASFAPPGDALPKDGWEPGAWYLIRYDETRYELKQIVDASRNPRRRLFASRTIALSPFGDGIVYFGGYDAAKNPSHNTAWIFAAPLATAFGPQPGLQDRTVRIVE
jgi:hypothetical protein